MKTFTADLIHPVSEEIVACEVSYRIADVGNGPSKWRPVIERVMAGAENILPLLGTSDVHELEDKAETHDQDLRAVARFGTEAV